MKCIDLSFLINISIRIKQPFTEIERKSKKSFKSFLTGQNVFVLPSHWSVNYRSYYITFHWSTIKNLNFLHENQKGGAKNKPLGMYFTNPAFIEIFQILHVWFWSGQTMWFAWVCWYHLEILTVLTNLSN